MPPRSFLAGPLVPANIPALLCWPRPCLLAASVSDDCPTLLRRSVRQLHSPSVLPSTPRNRARGEAIAARESCRDRSEDTRILIRPTRNWSSFNPNPPQLLIKLAVRTWQRITACRDAPRPVIHLSSADVMKEIGQFACLKILEEPRLRTHLLLAESGRSFADHSIPLQYRFGYAAAAVNRSSVLPYIVRLETKPAPTGRTAGSSSGRPAVGFRSEGFLAARQYDW